MNTYTLGEPEACIALEYCESKIHYYLSSYTRDTYLYYLIWSGDDHFITVFKDPGVRPRVIKTFRMLSASSLGSKLNSIKIE